MKKKKWPKYPCNPGEHRWRESWKPGLDDCSVCLAMRIAPFANYLWGGKAFDAPDEIVNLDKKGRVKRYA